MKHRLWIFVVGIALVLFWILWPRSPVNYVMPEEKTESQSKLTTTAQIPQSGPSTELTTNEVRKARSSEKIKKAQEEELREIAALNRAIDFYGQTIDQDGNPLPGVEITMTVPHYVAFSLDGKMIHLSRISDQNGFFDIHDASVTGDAVDIESMIKNGYTLEPMRRGLGPVGGAPGSPIIFKLWRNDIKEPLIKGGKSFPIEPDGTTYVIDFAKGTISSSGAEVGDFKLHFNLPQPIDRKHPNWSCEFQPVNGGLAEEPDASAAMYLAPTSGYSNLFNFAISPTNPWTRQSGTLRFYLCLKDGKEYGRISIDMAMWARKPNILRVEYAVNPNGSRILR
jgi:hypothetical protein